MSGRADTNLLFVYGTLMKGHSDDWQKRAGAHLVGHGRTTGKLYDLGQFPGAVVSSDPRCHIEGEVYRLDDISLATEILDEYEEFHPSRPEKSLFIRRELPVVMEDGTEKRAWVYLYNRAVNESDLIQSGNYRERIPTRR
ncbi:MAG: gamma-glutamylcyclotransferase family protein [Candidatus Acidiferrales bacterium]